MRVFEGLGANPADGLVKISSVSEGVHEGMVGRRHHAPATRGKPYFISRWPAQHRMPMRGGAMDDFAPSIHGLPNHTCPTIKLPTFLPDSFALWNAS